MSYIYKITNDINGKLYVGKTNYTIEKRFEEHIHDSTRKRCEKRPLYEAMNKYGIEHFYIEEIEEVNTDEEACVREQYWIDKLHTYIGFKDCNGYNATLGGDSKKYKNFDIEKMIKKYYETHNIELISKMFSLEYSYVIKILKQNGVKLINANEAKVEKSGKKIYQLEIGTLNIIKIFKTQKEAYKCINKKYNGNIGDACRARHGNHHAYGYD